MYFYVAENLLLPFITFSIESIVLIFKFSFLSHFRAFLYSSDNNLITSISIVVINQTVSNTNKSNRKKGTTKLKETNKSTVNKTKKNPIVDISGMNNKIENTEVQISRESENLNNQATNLGLFIPT